MNIDEQYLNLIAKLLKEGNNKTDRTGVGTKSLFSHELRHNMSEGFPLLTCKFTPFKQIFIELMWFLRGETNIKPLIEAGCNIWNGDAYRAYKADCEKFPRKQLWPTDLSEEQFVELIKTDEEFASKYGELGPIYGHQWRKKQVDQIQTIINTLKTDPDSRRLLVNSWDVDNVKNMTLPPCHFAFEFYSRELSYEERKNAWYLKVEPSESVIEYVDGLSLTNSINIFDQDNVSNRAISLKFHMRSSDCVLGTPFNIASYGLLLELIAAEVHMVPDELIATLGDYHIYNNHLEAAAELLSNEPAYHDLPKLQILNKREKIEDYQFADIYLTGYKSNKTIKAKLNN